MLYRFAGFELDTQLYELRRDGEACPLERQVFDVLAYLVEHQDRVVPKSELLDQVWGSRFVSDATLSSRIMSARRAVGDSGKQQRFIQTVQGRGFRFVGGAELASSAVGASTPPQLRPTVARQEQHIRFCTAADGVRIAYATIGEGPPLVKAANWLSHLEFDWRSPIWRHWIEELSRDHLFVKYDERGSGLSDHDVADCSFASWVDDLEAVIDAVGLERVALLGVSQGGPVAISYAVRHPERVSNLVLYGAYAQGWGVRAEDAGALAREEREAQITLTRHGWGRDNPAYRHMFTLSFIPEATPDEANWFNDLQRVSTSAENAARLMEATRDIDVTPLLPRVRVPTLVLHGREDQRVPFEQGRLLAASIPNARFVPLDSRNHILLERESAWAEFLREVRTFLGVSGSADASPARGPAPATVLFTDMVASTASTQKLGDAAAQALLRRHNQIVREALARNGGREVKHTGDGIMAAFTSPSRALQSAVDMQRDFAAEGDALSVRIGLNAGEPIEEEGDLFGTTVQLARRVCDHARGGQILVSDVVRQLAAGKGFAFTSMDRFVPKGMESAIDVFEVAWRD